MPRFSQDVCLTWKGILSKSQEYASRKIVETIEKKQSILVWAVCGAGKTEMLFSGIEHALRSGKYVCIASPRKDVIIELFPRIKESFPRVDVLSIFGESDDRGKISPLVLATTHQLLHYKHAFDVMIIDEVDAFPYSVDRSLAFAVKKACKPQSSFIYLTATPSKPFQKQFCHDQNVIIPVRHHGHPLPIPQFVWIGSWKKKLKVANQLNRKVVTWIKEQVSENNQAFLFVPDVSILEEVVKVLQKIDERIVGVHAEDPNRIEKVSAFRKGEVPVIVTTTILERGVTIKGANVGVLGAESSIFTDRALVQMSGRVGRSKECPTGTILFFSLWEVSSYGTS
ncbi:helicase-related protein [Bacillus carboniphilus]|uniref:Helicase-related protein n=1 Tax=Bacillus carboniphilus TaxID=86663 RepID=A0ABY9JV18_9BACI|nr:helicase-related protein [Bacillus carboniphilus]WLR41495.1 helicase-related protein [Bacillus carboniphilus]